MSPYIFTALYLINSMLRDLGLLRCKKKNKIPVRERWLWKNKKALQQVKRGLQDSTNGKIKSRSNFKKN
jgi:hypothetical protein